MYRKGQIVKCEVLYGGINNSIRIGMTGQILKVKKGTVLVKWNGLTTGHNASGLSNENDCWWMPETAISHCKKKHCIKKEDT